MWTLGITLNGSDLARYLIRKGRAAFPTEELSISCRIFIFPKYYVIIGAEFRRPGKGGACEASKGGRS